MKLFPDSFVKYYSSTIGNRNIVDTTLTLPLVIQTIFGQQILDPNWWSKGTILKHIFHLVLHIYAIIGTIVFMEDATDTTLKAEACFTIIITVMLFMKYSLYINNRSSFQKAYLIAKTTVFDIIKESSYKKSSEFLNKIKIIIKLLLVTVSCPVVAYILANFWNCAHGVKTTLSKTTSILMPMRTPYYEIGLILHIAFMFGISFTLIVIDMWFVILTFFFCEASDALGDLLTVKQRKEEPNNEYATRLNDTLKQFYVQHVKLMEYLNILSNMYKWPTLIPLLNVLLIFCLILFLVSEEIKLTFLSNLLPGLVECFAYNWFGEQLQTKATSLKMALMQFDWSNMNVKDMKNYLIIVGYTKKDISLKTAVGNDLSMSTMSAVLKASYQAFAVLKSNN